MPSALSEPRGSIFFCDNRCSEKAVRCWQFASVVVERSSNSEFVSAVLLRAAGTAGRAEAELVAMESSRGGEGTSWKNLENHGKRAFHASYVGVFFSHKGRGEEDSGRCRAGEARRNTRSVAAGISSQGDLGAGQKIEDMGCSSEVDRKGYVAMRDSRWEDFKEECRVQGKSSEWAPGTIREAYEKVVKEEAGRLGVVRAILRKSTDFLRRIIAPVEWEESLCRTSARTATVFSVGLHLVSTAKKRCSWWCAICGERYEWRAPDRILAVQLGANEDEAKVFRAHAVAQGLCENLIDALKLLAKQQKYCDSPIQNIIMKEKCRERITNRLRSFIASSG